MKLPLYWVDAFAKSTFAGNPAAVVPLATWLDDALMQRIAFENGLAETAFFVRTGPTRFHLRWFTPIIEMDLCGHATLATASVLFNQLGQSGDSVTFDSRSGPLIVGCRGELLELDFPARPATPVETPADLARALGRAPDTVARTERMWLCVYAADHDVQALRPDHAALGRITPGRMIVTAPGSDCDFVSRFFAPDAGVAEDPVTGSAHCTLVPYWAERLGRTKLHARQVSARGGELWCELVPSTASTASSSTGSEQGGQRVKMAGHAVLYLRGEIEV